MQFEVMYASAASEFLRPVIHAVRAMVSDSQGVSVAVQVTDPEIPGGQSSGIAAVVVTYTQSQGGSSWQSSNLELVDASAGLWEGMIDVSGAIDFFVQAVDGSGNVGMFAGNGYFSPVVVMVEGPESAVQGQPVSFSAFVPGELASPNFLWDFGDGSRTAGDSTVVHTFSEPGVSTVSVSVVDSLGNLGQDSTDIVIEGSLDTNLHDPFSQIIALIHVVEELPDESLKNSPDDRRSSLVVKLSEVGQLIYEGDGESAIMKLTNDIQSKLDGCPPEADKNDWVIDCADQVEIQDKIYKLIEAIENLD
jgi:hypothetical protein